MGMLEAGRLDQIIPKRVQATVVTNYRKVSGKPITIVNTPDMPLLQCAECNTHPNDSLSHKKIPLSTQEHSDILNRKVGVPAEQQLGVILALKVFVDEVRQQLLEHSCGILHLPLQGTHDKRGHIAPVTHGEGALGLQGTDERQKKVLLV